MLELLLLFVVVGWGTSNVEVCRNKMKSMLSFSTSKELPPPLGVYQELVIKHHIWQIISGHLG